MIHKNIKNKEMSCFEVWMFCVGGLKASRVVWTSFMEACAVWIRIYFIGSVSCPDIFVAIKKYVVK
jgi:hypothetical protein